MGFFVKGIRTGDGLEKRTQKQAAGSKNADVDDAYGLTLDDVRTQFCTLSALMCVGIDADICLDHSGHFCIDIAICPR